LLEETSSAGEYETVKEKDGFVLVEKRDEVKEVRDDDADDDLINIA